jgi:protein-S-isoprenylcysteine O-methyltransferase Ste14
VLARQPDSRIGNERPLSLQPQSAICRLWPFLLGFALAWWTPLVVVGLLGYAALAYAVTLVEEEHLMRTYGASYREYCQRVLRYLGFPKE